MISKITWETVIAFFKEKYKVHDEHTGYISFVFALDGDRSQLVGLEQVGSGNDLEYISIASRVGEISARRLPAALESAGDMVLIGGLVKRNEFYYLRSVLPINGIDLDMLELLMYSLLTAADRLEVDFVGGDDN